MGESQKPGPSQLRLLLLQQPLAQSAAELQAEQMSSPPLEPVEPEVPVVPLAQTHEPEFTSQVKGAQSESAWQGLVESHWLLTLQ
jgi:hypothetical protein